MSSSNLVRVAIIEEQTVGVTPETGSFRAARFTSESFSATPSTTESKQIRTDRMASGNVVTGLEVSGKMSFELAKEPCIDMLMAGAMLNEWDVLPQVVVDLQIDATEKTITRFSGIWASVLQIGDILTLSGFVAEENNTQVQVVEFITDTVIRVVSNGMIVTEDGPTGFTAYKRADKLTIGSNKKTFSVEKTFTDLTTKAIKYKGKYVNEMDLSVAYGSIITGSFGFNGTKSETVSASADFMTNGRTIIPAATTNSMNGSIDMPFISSDILGTMDEVSFCIQSLGLKLSNNYSAQNCIGESSAVAFTPGTAKIDIDMSTYLSNINWEILGKKLTQEPFSIGFMLKNIDGWYGFYLPAIQTSFDDPSSSGANTEISLDMKGAARVGLDGSSALVIYRS